jgi:hypothetical protein
MKVEKQENKMITLLSCVKVEGSPIYEMRFKRDGLTYKCGIEAASISDALQKLGAQLGDQSEEVINDES